MLNDLSAVYSETLNECAKIPKTGLRLSDQFVEDYTNYINSTVSVPGGYVAVEFDVGSAVLTSAPTGNSDSVITCVSAYGFAVAHCLTPLMKELMAYKSRVDQIFSGCSKADTETLLKEVRKIPASPTAMTQLENLLQTLPADEQILVKKFVTDYSWWHGQKGIERDDFMYSPMLSCSKLVATSNGAIPTITKHFSADASLYSVFKFSIAQKDTVMSNQAYQIITYGAPGTGKSHKIDELTNESNSIRVTFHPDSDYSTFVGCYKPTMLPNVQNKILNKDELIKELLLLKKQGGGYPCQKFGFKFYNSLQNLNKSELLEILKKCEFTESMTSEIDKAKSVASFAQLSEKNDIVYEFVPQAFIKAYVEAWRRYTNAELKDSEKNYYLVIEEINRGNCAQIFGDLFQLLDRADNGFSSYAITPDNDIQNFLQTDKKYKLAGIPLSEDIEKQTKSGVKVIATADDIKTGKKLVLPPNLFIRATMNTSDQSLFPMDSAFKRRWDWKYVPIKNANLGWEIVFGDCKVDWWKFLVAINKVVKSVTNSADKQMGYFFVKAKNSEIDAEMFVNKVAFYLWNDVFKDCELDGDAFKITREGDEVDVLAFQDFFKEDGTINEEVLKNFLTNLVSESETAPGEFEVGSAADGEA